jgi:hypothetical protein
MILKPRWMPLSPANKLLEQEVSEVVDFWCSSGFHRGKLRIRDLP